MIDESLREMLNEMGKKLLLNCQKKWAKIVTESIRRWTKQPICTGPMIFQVFSKQCKAHCRYRTNICRCRDLQTEICTSFPNKKAQKTSNSTKANGDRNHRLHRNRCVQNSKYPKIDKCSHCSEIYQFSRFLGRSWEKSYFDLKSRCDQWYR